MNLRQARRWTPPDEWTKLVAIDAHTGGEPLRVIVDGTPEIPGDTMLERRRYAASELDGLRRTLMWEPRGHADMYGCLVTAPVTREADFGVLFLHNEGFSTMCGHGIIAVVTVLIETGAIQAVEPGATLTIDTPAGPVTARASLADDRVRRVAFRNVPSYVVALNETVEVPRLGTIHYDLAFGGAYYAYVDAASAGVRLEHGTTAQLIARGRAIKRALVDRHALEHPFDAGMGFLYGTIFIGPAAEEGSDSRHVCVFADGEVDRSPTGTGVSGRLAIHRARGELAPGDSIVVESILGSRFTGRLVGDTRFGPHDAVIPEIEGSAHITGRNELWTDPADPFAEGFLLR